MYSRLVKGMDVINVALETALGSKDIEQWTPVTVNVASATLTILKSEVRAAIRQIILTKPCNDHILHQLQHLSLTHRQRKFFTSVACVSCRLWAWGRTCTRLRSSWPRGLKTSSVTCSGAIPTQLV